MLTSSVQLNLYKSGLCCGEMYLFLLRELCANAFSEMSVSETPWPESTSELYQPSDSRLSAKLMTTFADRGCHVVSVTDPHGRILGFLDREMSASNLRMREICPLFSKEYHQQHIFCYR
jgi:hypothetical protein